jgi:hypothetical protein
MTTQWDKDLAWYQTVFQQNSEIERNGNQVFCCFYLKDVKLVLMQGDRDGICQVVLKSEHDRTITKLESKLCHGADILIEHQ